MSDAYDDFQIKPLTQGLGFHKKAINLSEQISRSGVPQESIQRPIPEAPPAAFFGDVRTDRPSSNRAKEALDRLTSGLKLKQDREVKRAAFSVDLGLEDELQITSPLPRAPENDIFSGGLDRQRSPNSAPRPTFIEEPELREEKKSPSRPVVTGVLPIPPSTKVKEKVGVQRSAHDSRRGPLTPSAISLPSIILDGVLVIALSLVFLVSLLSVTKVEILSVAFNAQSDAATQLSLGILFVAIMQMYVVVARSFFGRTLGEWTFDHQMGHDEQHKSGLYPLLVAWRSFLIVITGVITLPLLSLIFRKDLTARLSGLQLYQRR
ncbi:MAG: RDD family protein [Bdellovibrionales bacterium]|nr:RDD family protein [Bdellovibrionales bacterium]